MVAHQILHYLKGTLGLGLALKRNSKLMKYVYVDANYVGSLADCRSMAGYCSFLGDNHVTWRSKKQDSIGAKFLALEQGTCEALWVKGSWTT